ncbi:MAG: molybdopterin-dependent oxidoreductase [Candidatus Eisenbacteria bacterium]|nr:molybdopterin-dependent oxidoreductase [Candidatus Eisenbacteria bacterium]
MSRDELYYRSEIEVPETPPPGEPPEPWGETSVVGRPKPRVDGYERVSGAAVYPSDVVLPNMLYGAFVRSPHPHARVRKVDTRQAAAMPGVRAVITGQTPQADLNWNYGRGLSTKIFPEVCRFEGEPVAAVAADTPYQARAAARAIAVEYEVLPFVSDERKALKEDAPKIHADGNRAGETQEYSRGDVEQGFASADVVRERSYRTACEMHTPMELHGCVASWDGKRLTVWESSQGVYAIQSQLCGILGLPRSRVRVIGHYMGGGFGSKLRTSPYSVVAALLAAQTGRPVKLILSREETYLAMGNRPPSNMTLKAGVTRDGKLTALEFTGLGTGGAYPAGGTSLLDWLVKDLYTCPNVRTELTDVYINAGPARPFRAPGHPQGSWALEQMMDELAEAIGIDPVELRLKNIPAASQGRGGVPYTTTGLARCIEEGAREFGWKEARERNRSQESSEGDDRLRRGVGMGACVWIAGGGGPPSTIVLKLYSDGSVNLNMGASDIGTGTKTVMAMVVAEELGVSPDSIQIENADTGTTQFATPSGGSKTVPTEAPAVRDAAVALKRRLLDWAAQELGVEVDQLDYQGEEIVLRDGAQRVNVRDLETLNRRGVAVGVGYRGPNPEGKVVCPFAAQFCEVEVDTRTGEVKILRFLGAHDSGRVMDRLTFDNQVYGGIVMGIGLGTTEVRTLDHDQTGKLCNKNWHDYKLPTALDVAPEVTSVPIEMDDPEANIAGAKGLGEPVTIPTAAAIANAVYDAVGIRVTDTPINPVQLSRLLAAQRREG